MQGISGDIIIVLGGTILLLCIFGFIFFFVVAYNRRYRKYEAEKIEMKKQFELEKIQSQLEIQEQTLKIISGEIHDNIGQILSLVGLQISAIPTDKPEKLDQTIELLNRAITDLRDMSKRLDSDRISSIGIIEAITMEMNLIERTGKFATELFVDADFAMLTSDETIILYRIVQEILNNIIKHSKGTKISIHFLEDNSEDILTIKDDGIGFNPKEMEGKGLGLNNIVKRAKLIGGTATINSLLNKGTIITFKIPKKVQ